MAVAAATTDVPTPPLTDQYQMIMLVPPRAAAFQTAGLGASKLCQNAFEAL